MPLKTDPFWTQKFLDIKANNERWGATRIRCEAEALSKGDGDTSANSISQSILQALPSVRTVERILKREWETLSEEERRQYRPFYWPESMESGCLPWEASGPLLDFLERRGRPTNRLAKWFWRLYQVAQLAEGDECLTELDRIEAKAREIAAHEMSGAVPEYALRRVESWLACHGWTESGEEITTLVYSKV